MNRLILVVIAIIVICLILFLIWFECPSHKKIEHMSQLDDRFSFADNQIETFQKPFVIQNFISEDKCNELIQLAKNQLVDSVVLGGKIKSIRNSQQCWVSRDHSAVKEFYDRASKLFDIPLDHAENLQIVRYLPGQYYNEHHDSCCDKNESCQKFIDNGGQRKLTILIYLSNDFDDGETFFRLINLKIKPSVGSAIVFYPLAKGTSKCHPLALHAGLPVTRGEKWIANIWFRERPHNQKTSA